MTNLDCTARIYYRHVRHPLKPSQYIGTTCLIQFNDGSFRHSFSQCSPLDTFSKKVGRTIAFNRAWNDFCPNEVPLKLYNPDGSRYRLYPVTNELVNMVIDAERRQPVEV